MAHGENAKQKGHAGREYWASRLRPGGELPGRFTKTATHRKERRLARKSIRRGQDATTLGECGCGKHGVKMRECIECGEKACEECAKLTWRGNVCCRCVSKNPVFYDQHSRRPGDVDPRDGAAR